MKCIDSKEVYHLIAGDLDRDRVSALESHFSHCEHCSALHTETSDIAGRLAPDNGEFDDLSLTDDIMTLIRLGRAKSETLKQSWWIAFRTKWQGLIWLPVVAGATAALLLTIWSQVDFRDAPRFQTRGVAENRDRWVSIQAFQKRVDIYQPINDSMFADDLLAFSYSNRSAGRYQYLMIFAVAEKGTVFWYYPAHEDETKNPTSVLIDVSDKSINLPDQVHHDLGTGFLRIFGVFSEKPLDVRTVESVVTEDLKTVRMVDQLTRLNLDGTGQHSFLVDVRSNAERR